MAALAVVALMGADVAGARTDDRKKTIYFLHGADLDRPAGYDCASYWGKVMERFRDFGHAGLFRTVRYYGGDSGCSDDLHHHGSHSRHFSSGHYRTSTSSEYRHNADASIRHLAYHFAWDVWAHHSKDREFVDVVTHSMGGLIVRYALAQVERNHPAFPSTLRIEDVVTLAAPHAGTNWAAFCGWRECNELVPGTTFVEWLADNARHPDGRGRTDWSTIGSHSDYFVSAVSANGMNSDHRLAYLQSNYPVIGHESYLALGAARKTADAERWNGPGVWVIDYSSHWPIRRADLAVTLGSR